MTKAMQDNYETPIELKGILMADADGAIQQVKNWYRKIDLMEYARHRGWTDKEAEDIMRAAYYTHAHVNYEELAEEKCVDAETMFALDILDSLNWSQKFHSMLEAAKAYGIHRDCASDSSHGMLDENVALTKLRRQKGVLEVFTSYNEPEAKQPSANKVIVVRNTHPHVCYGWITVEFDNNGVGHIL